VNLVVTSRRASAGTVFGLRSIRRPSARSVSDTSWSRRVKFRSIVRTSTRAGPRTRRSRGSTCTCSTSTVSTRRAYTSRRIPPKFHQPPVPKPLKAAGRQWVRSVLLRIEETSTTSVLRPFLRFFSHTSKGK
jgi:hypothetical protein